MLWSSFAMVASGKYTAQCLYHAVHSSKVALPRASRYGSTIMYANSGVKLTRISQETQSKEVDMSEDSPSHAQCLISYLYTMDYNQAFHHLDVEELSRELPNSDDNLTLSSSKEHPEVQELNWTWDIEMWKLADKYNVPRLMALSRSHILGGPDGNLAYALDFLPGFIGMVKALYTCGSSLAAERLRHDVFRRFSYVSSEVSKEPVLRRLAEEVPLFPCDLLKVLSDKHQKRRRKGPKEYASIARYLGVSPEQVKLAMQISDIEADGENDSESGDESVDGEATTDARDYNGHLLPRSILARRIYTALIEKPRSADGVAVQSLALQLRVSMFSVFEAAGALIDTGSIYKTVDDCTFAPLLWGDGEKKADC